MPTSTPAQPDAVTPADASPAERNRMREVLPSVVVAVHNAASYIEGYLQRLSALMQEAFEHYEVIIVDDGSHDNTVAKVAALQQTVPGLTLLGMSSRRGSDVAVIAGLEHAIGDFALVLNPRLDPPELVTAMVLEAVRGTDIVYAVPQNPPQSGKLATAVMHKFLRFVARAKEIDLPLAEVSSRLVSRAVLNFMLKPANRHRILTVSPALSGYSHRIVAYQRDSASSAAGEAGDSLIGAIAKSISLALAISVRPLRAVSLLALAGSAVSMLYSIYVIGYWLFAAEIAPGWTSLSLQVSGLFFFVSLVLAVMSEYLLQVLEGTGSRPLYYLSQLSHSAQLAYDDQLNVLNSSEAGSDDPEETPKA